MSERKRRQAQQRQASSSLYERYKDALRRGHVAALRGRLEPAIDAYGEAASIATDRALPHAAIGGILVRMGRIPEALEAYDRALALAARDETALRGRAEALRSLGRRVEAADTLDRLAELLDGGGKVPDATDAARRALELAESKERRRYVEALAVRLRAMDGDEAAKRALAQVLRFLEPPVAPPVEDVAEAAEVEQPPPEPEPEQVPSPNRSRSPNLNRSPNRNRSPNLSRSPDQTAPSWPLPPRRPSMRATWPLRGRGCSPRLRRTAPPLDPTPRSTPVMSPSRWRPPTSTCT